MKRSISLLISWLLGATYLSYIFFYFVSAGANASGAAEAIGAGIATMLVLPHMSLLAIAVIFNVIGWAANKRWAALTGAILYCVSALSFLLYFFFEIPSIVLSFVGYATMHKVVKEGEYRGLAPETVRPVQKPFQLTSNDLIHAPAMLEYAKFYGFQNGATDPLCLELFRKVEQAISPAPQVVMTFMAKKDGKPVACAMSNTEMVLAGVDSVQVIPIMDIERFSNTPHIHMFRKNADTEVFDVDRQKGAEILDFLERSLRACQEEIATTK